MGCGASKVQVASGARLATERYRPADVQASAQDARLDLVLDDTDAAKAHASESPLPRDIACKPPQMNLGGLGDSSPARNSRVDLLPCAVTAVEHLSIRDWLDTMRPGFAVRNSSSIANVDALNTCISASLLLQAS